MNLIKKKSWKKFSDVRIYYIYLRNQIPKYI